MASVQRIDYDKETGIHAKNSKGQYVFRLFYDGPKNADGSRNQIKKTWKFAPDSTKRLNNVQSAKKAFETAQSEADSLEEKANKPQKTKEEPQGETFEQLAERWLKYKAGTKGKGQRQPKTMGRYRELINRLYEYEDIKDKQVSSFNKKYMERFYEWLGQQRKKPGRNHKTLNVELDKLSRETVWHHHRVLSSILNYGIDPENGLKVNPCKDICPVDRPEDTLTPEMLANKKIKCFNSEQVAILKILIKSEPLREQVLVGLALDTGARVAELLALKWSDINLDTRIMDINKAWQYTPEFGRQEKVPKNDFSYRKNMISVTTINLLRSLKSEQEKARENLGSKWVESNAVFTAWNGGQIHPTHGTIWWREWIRTTDLPVIKFHDLRHTVISHLVDAGVNPFDIAQMVGHANPQMIMKTYGHSLKAQFAGCDIMESIGKLKLAELEKEVV